MKISQKYKMSTKTGRNMHLGKGDESSVCKGSSIIIKFKNNIIKRYQIYETFDEIYESCDNHSSTV